MSLDGDISNMQAWHFEYWGDEARRTAEDVLGAADALLMGRLTYEAFAEAWPTRSGDDFADRMNAIPKYAVSTTLQRPTWNNTTVVSGDVVAEVRTLKDATDGDIVQYGFGDVSRLLLANGLLDELKIWLHPVLSGQATQDDLLYRDMPQARFSLAGTDVHSTGIIVLTYVPTA
jgi:dihydrofolate reductase